MKIGIVVPFSWSFWGAVVEHAELQAAALEERGHDVRLIMGNDPPGQFTRVLHPRVGRHGNPPPNVIPVGRTVIVPANGSLPNIVLSPRSYLRIVRDVRARALRRPPPARADDADDLPDDAHPRPLPARRDVPRVGRPRLDEGRGPLWGFLIDRIDHRIAVSERARESQSRWLPGEYEVIPNGVLVPPSAPAGDREHRIVFAGRQEPRKGLQVLLRAWPDIHRRSGLRLTVAGADPLAVRLLLTRLRVPDDGIDVVGFLSQDELTRTLLGAKALVAPSIGQESFGMVLTRAFACALPAVASDIPGYREVLTPEAAVSVAPNDPDAWPTPCARSSTTSRAARRWARRPARSPCEQYAWPAIAARLEEVYAASPGSPSARRAPHEAVLRVWRSGWAQGALALAALVLAFVVIWWRGPDWGSVFDAFKVVIWSWIVLAFLLNVVSTLFRALSWRLTVGQALPPEHQPRLVHVLSSFGVGLLANAVVPGRLGELARVATLRRHLPDAPPGTSATLVGTVFAHRLFDLVPASILVVWVLLTAEVPHWAVVSITIAAAVGFALFTVAWLGAKRHDRPVVSEGMGSARQLVSMGRQGLSVLKAPVPLAGADPPPVPGLAHAAARGVRRDAGVRHRRAASRRRARPRADEHRDDRAALAREHRARAGGRRDPAPQLRRSVRDRASRTASRCRRSRSRAASRSG